MLTATSIFANQTYDWIQMTQFIQYAANGVTETFRYEYNYDAAGREMGYNYYYNGMLSNKTRDYQYNGRTVIYWLDNYSGGNLQSSNKVQKTYCDKNWIQTTLSIQYAANGVTETYRVETDYDNDGRETGYRQYQNGVLLIQYRNYQYNGRTLTHWMDVYSGGNTSSSKFQRTYCDKNWIQTTISIQYAANGVTEAFRVETDYDNDGRETGYRQYQNGTLSVQYRNYQYNGRTLTHWMDVYSGGNTSSSKIQRVYKDKTSHIINATAGANGTITPVGEIEVEEGKNQTFTFTANSGYEIEQVLIDGTNNSTAVNTGSYTFEKVTENHTIHVTFKTIGGTTHTINATAGANGTITPVGDIEVEEGENQTFTFTANSGYEIDQVLIDGTNNLAAVFTGSYTFENVTKAHTIVVNFKATAGIAETIAEKIKIYPNPTQNELRIESGDLCVEKVEILDIAGRIVLTSHETEINISHFLTGTYFVKLKTNKGELTKRVIKE